MPVPDLMLTEAELRFDRLRRRVGLVAAPALVLLVLWLQPANMSVPAARLLALLAGTLVLWMTEALPIPVTSVLAPAVGVLLGIAPADKMFAPFGNPLLFLFVGAFLLAQAAERTRLDRVLALRLFARKDATPWRTLSASTAVSAGLSGLFSNTATTAMMMPLVRAAVEHLGARVQAIAVLTAAYASSIGGVLTPIGTPPNLLAIAALRQYAHRDVPFFLWTVVALPMAAILLAVWLAIVRRTLRLEAERPIQVPVPVPAPAPAPVPVPVPAPAPAPVPVPVPAPAPAPGQVVFWGLDRGQLGTLAVILLAALGWTLPGMLELALGSKSAALALCKRCLPEGVVALLAASLLFLLPAAPKSVGGSVRRRPILIWPEAAQIDWGTILLFGGGLALGEQVFQTGLSAWLGDAVLHATGVKTEVGLVILFSVTALVLSELTSNTATAAMICPLAVMTAQQIGVSPLPPCIAAGLSASMGFLMPISTAPNAIAYGTGKVPLLTMMRTGFVLDLAGLVVIPPTVLLVTDLLGLR